MKKSLIILFLCFHVLIGKAQLTKSETINYILEKVKEVEYMKLTYDAQFTFTITDISFKVDPNHPEKIIFTRKRNFSDNTSDQSTYSFFPKYIVKIEKEPVKPGDAVSYLSINLSGANATSKFISTSNKVNESSTSYILFPYLVGDPLHYERLSKALMHLKDLAIKDAKVDPYVN